MTDRIPFSEQLVRRWQQHQTLLCVGLDPAPERIPEAYRSAGAAKGDAILAFCCDMVDATAEMVCAFKPQFAYFAAAGAESALAELIDYIHSRHPGIPVILDAKRNDIGSTAERYAVEAFERYDADAVTVNPYLGEESVRPYLAYSDRGTIVLCRTSNPDSGWIQAHPQDDPVYLRVARRASEWNSNGNVMLVAGATYPEELALIRETVGDMALLVPGIGAQGGDLRSVLVRAATADGNGLVINASRAILYADPDDPSTGARTAASKMVSEIRELQLEVAPDRAVV